jgi:hypothetical protein
VTVAEPTSGPRAAQIQAVRDVMGWGPQPDAFNEQAVADTAAELVDAVHAASRDGQLVEAPDPGSPEYLRRMLAACRTDLKRAVSERDEARREREQGEARGWAKAVQALRDDARYEQWWNRIPRHPEATYWAKTGRDHLAGYLEAVGPGGEGQKLTEEEADG